MVARTALRRPSGRLDLGPPPRAGTGTRVTTGIALALTIVPLVVCAVALVVRFGGHYLPAGDIAGTEVHVRDVGHHPVLLGLFSRDRWNHPGPALFYLLALPYRLSGSRSISLHVGALLINAASIVGIALVARRHGRTVVMLLALVGCALLVHTFGPATMSSPWNPDVPVFPFALLLFLVWAMLCGDLWALPVAAAVATFCVQTHIGYTLLALPLLVFGTVWLVIATIRTHRNGRALARVGGIATAVVAAMWLPPVVQQLDHSSPEHHGNLGNIVFYFLHPIDPTRHTFAAGYRLMAGQFGAAPPWLTGHRAVGPFGVEPALLTSAPLPVWLIPLALAGIVVWRQRDAAAQWFALIVAAVVLLGVVWVARTPGDVYAYRIGWTFVVAMVAFLVIAWAATTVASKHFAAVRALFVPACIAALAVLGALNSFNAARVGSPQWPGIATLTRQVTAAIPPRGGDVILRCAGFEGCLYHQGIFLALEKRGLPVRTLTATLHVAADAEHLVHRRGPVRTNLIVSDNRDLYVQLAQPGARLVAFWGRQPRATIDEGVRQLTELDAKRSAGTVDPKTYAYVQGAIVNRLGNAVGVVEGAR